MTDWQADMKVLANHAAKHSPDPSSQNAAALYGIFGYVTGTVAVNKFPRGVDYSLERWERPLKYSYIEHAERNAIYNAARIGCRTKGLTLLCLWAACPDCARAIIQAGLSRLITMRPTDDGAHGGWDDGIKVAMGMLAEAGVKVEYIDGPLGVVVKRNGKDFEC